MENLRLNRFSLFTLVKKIPDTVFFCRIAAMKFAFDNMVVLP